MGVINIFKIDNEKVARFERELNTTPSLRTFRYNETDVECKFYLMNEATQGRVKWDWVLTEFNHRNIFKYSLPVGVFK